jgi:YgiT-type zinc finger domain-containing protein
MTCFFCKGNLEDKLTLFSADLGSGIVVVKNVPSQVCEQCGEVSYSGEVSRQLEHIADSLKTAARNTVSATEIAVVNYSAKAA